MGLFNQAASKVPRPRGSSESEDKIPEDTNPDDVSVLFVPIYPVLPFLA